MTDAPTLREELVRQLADLGVRDVPMQGPTDAVFSSLEYGGKSFAHFHDDNELDLRLTKLVIAREGLIHLPDSRVHPKRKKGSQWIELRFSEEAHISDVVRLVALAIAEL